MKALELKVSVGYTSGDINSIVKNIHPIDREECRFFTSDLGYHIKSAVQELEGAVVTVHDHNGKLWWIGGVAPSHSEVYSNSGFGWLLRTKFCKARCKADKVEMRNALDEILTLLETETSFERVANIVWNQQKRSVKWLESEGFTIEKDKYGTITRSNGTQGIFYQFNKIIARG